MTADYLHYQLQRMDLRRADETRKQQQQQQQDHEQERSTAISPPCVEFSAMGFDDQSTVSSTPSSVSDYSADKFNYHVNRSIAMSRQSSCACLKTLADAEARKAMPSNANNKRRTTTTASTTRKSFIPSSLSMEEEAWGYFVDTPDF